MWCKIPATRLMRLRHKACLPRKWFKRDACRPVASSDASAQAQSESSASNPDAEPLVRPRRRRGGRLGWSGDFPDPGDALHEFGRRMDDVFDALDRRFGVPWWRGGDQATGLRRHPGRGRVAGPSVDVQETSDKFVLMADVPGMKAEDVSVKVGVNRVVTIRGAGGREWGERRDGEWVCRERSWGGFTRSFQLPDDADADRITAAVKDGVLTVEIAKREGGEQREREVPVQ